MTIRTFTVKVELALNCLSPDIDRSTLDPIIERKLLATPEVTAVLDIKEKESTTQ